MTSLYMLVDSVVAYINLSALEPAVERRLGAVKYLSIGLEPVYFLMLSQLCEVGLSVGCCLLKKFRIVRVFKLTIFSNC